MIRATNECCLESTASSKADSATQRRFRVTIARAALGRTWPSFRDKAPRSAVRQRVRLARTPFVYRQRACTETATAVTTSCSACRQAAPTSAPMPSWAMHESGNSRQRSAPPTAHRSSPTAFGGDIQARTAGKSGATVGQLQLRRLRPLARVARPAWQAVPACCPA